jgi:hypothetical protein
MVGYVVRWVLVGALGLHVVLVAFMVTEPTRQYTTGRLTRAGDIRYERTEPQPVRATRIEGDVITLRVEQRDARRYRNHDPRLLQLAVDRYGEHVALRESLLCFPARDRDLVFNLQPADEPWRACSPAVPSRH